MIKQPFYLQAPCTSIFINWFSLKKKNMSLIEKRFLCFLQIPRFCRNKLPTFTKRKILSCLIKFNSKLTYSLEFHYLDDLAVLPDFHVGLFTFVDGFVVYPDVFDMQMGYGSVRCVCHLHSVIRNNIVLTSFKRYAKENYTAKAVSFAMFFS